MNTVILIIIIAILVLLAASGWLILIAISVQKKAKSKEALERWFRINLVLTAVALITSCSPGKMVGTGYLVSIKKQGKTNNYKVNTRHEADSIYRANVGPEKLGQRDPFYEFRNSEVFIYIEKKGVYEKNGKARWRVYDEKLINK